MKDNKGFLMFLFTFIMTLLLSLKTYAADVTVNAVDQMGYPVVFDEDNYALCSGDVTFYVKAYGLKEDEAILFDDGGIVSAVTDGVALMHEKEDGMIGCMTFYLKTKDGTEEIFDRPFAVEFKDKAAIPVNASFHEAKGTKDAFVRISPSRWVNTFFVINDGENTVRQHITKDTEISFSDEGEFKIFAYNMDGKGNRTYSGDLPDIVTVDKTPPVTGDIEIDKPVSGDGKVISSETVEISVSAYDELSGLEGVYFCLDGAEEIKGDCISINPPYKGGVSFYTVDRAGNVSKKQSIVKELVADNTAPVINAVNRGFENGVIKLEMSAEDDLCGVLKLKADLEGKTVFENDGSKEEFSFDISNMKYGSKKLMLTAWDKAGNKAEGSVILEKKDSTPPVIAFHGVSDRGVYGNDADVYIEVSDDSGKTASYSANVMVTDSDGRMIYSQSTDSRSIRITQSGYVTIRAEASDYDGNSASSQLSFIIDRESPEIKGVEEYDGKILNEFSLKEPAQDMVDDLSFVTCDVYLNGLEYDGKAVTKDGKYVLKVTARDEFGNESMKEADFTIKNEEVSKNAAVPENNKKMYSGSGKIKSPSENKLKDPKTTVSESSVKGSKRQIPETFLDKIKYAIIKIFGVRKAENTT